MAIVKALRGYQADLYRRLNRARNNGKDAVMILPTGAGKTVIASLHCFHVLNHSSHTGIKHVIITTPQKQILAGFLRTNNEEWHLNGKHSSQKIDNVTIQSKETKDIASFLKGSSGNQIAISCIQSITNQRSNAFNPFEEIDDCSNILWVIDEAHHIEAEQTAIVISEFKRKNGKILYLTATPFNSEGALRILNNPDIEIIHRSLGEHMNDGFAPELDMCCKMFDVSAGIQNKYGEFSSDTSCIKAWATNIASTYVEDNRPKTLVVIPSFSKSGDIIGEDLTTQNAANTLKTELEILLPGITVLSVVGNDGSGELSKQIEVEANTFPGHDIIIACRRFDEGTDVPAISAVYLIGMTGCRRIIQLMGRALRNKSGIKGFADKHPDYLNRSLFRFFTFQTRPTTDDDIEDRQYDFSLAAIKTINAVQNFRSYNVIAGAVKVRRKLQERIEGLLEDDPTNPDIEVYEDSVSEIEKPIIALETAGEDDNSMLALLAHSKMEHTNEEALENASEVATAYVQSMLLSDELESDEDVEEFVDRIVTRKRRDRNSKVVNEELEELVTQYANEKVYYVESDLIKTFTTAINKNTLEEWGDVLWNVTGFEERQWEKINQIIEFENTHNRLPSIRTKNELEIKLSKYLTQIRMAKWNPDATSMVIYESTIKKLSQLNKLYILDNKEKRQYKLTVDLIEWINTNNRMPDKDGDIIEREMEKFLTRLRNLHNAPEVHRGKIYQETYSIIEAEGKLDILDRRNFATEQLSKLQSVVNFVEKHGRLPSPTAKDETENYLGNILGRCRSAKNNSKYQGKLYEESVNYLNSKNMMWILDHRDNIGDQLEKTKKLVEFYRVNSRFPSKLKGEEASLYKFYNNIRIANNRQERKTRDAIVYQETIEYLNMENMYWMLNPADFENKQLNRIRDLIKYVEVNNRLPTQRGNNREDRSLYVFLKNLRNAYFNCESNRKIYDSVMNEIKHANMVNVLFGKNDNGGES